MAQSLLDGVRVLVVEDDFLVSLLFEDLLRSAGCVVLGPVPRFADAVDAAAKVRCDVAVLDVDLAGERVYPVAAVLFGRNVPFIFVTGCGYDAIPPEFAGQPRIAKPFSAEQLSRALSKAVRTTRDDRPESPDSREYR
jgi:two-component SAPR family response regulator